MTSIKRQEKKKKNSDLIRLRKRKDRDGCNDSPKIVKIITFHPGNTQCWLMIKIKFILIR